MDYIPDLSTFMFVDFGLFLQARRKGKLSALPRFQEAEQLGLLASGTSLQRPHYFVSHRWDAPDHPDPTGWQIDALHQFAAEQEGHERMPCYFWYDFICLPQGSRTSSEEQIFRAGLQKLNDLSVGCKTIALVSGTGDALDDFRQQLLRGWILCEMMVAHHNQGWSWTFHQSDHEIFACHRRRIADQFLESVVQLLDTAPVQDKHTLRLWFNSRGVACTNRADLDYLADRIAKYSHDIHHDWVNMPVLPQLGTPIFLSYRDVSKLRIDRWGKSAYFPGFTFKCVHKVDLKGYEITVNPDTA